MTRIKDLERENNRLKKAVADLSRDKLILQEAVEGNYEPFETSALCEARERHRRDQRAASLPDGKIDHNPRNFTRLRSACQ
jgi:hypothetical protein